MPPVSSRLLATDHSAAKVAAVPIDSTREDRVRIYPFVLLSLVSCVTAEDAAREQAQYVQALRQRCYAYGFKPGEAATANCVMQLDTLVQRQRAANNAANAAMAMQMLGSQNATLQPGFSCWRMGDYLQCQ
jgi:hypothetical protein